MGGGSGGYERPSDSGGSGESSESDSVPPPESDTEEETSGDQPDESNETSDETTPESPPATGGGGGSGVPESGPGNGSSGIPEEDDSEPERDEPSLDEGTEDGEPEEPEDNSGHNDEESERQNPADSGPEDESDDADSNNAEQEGGQENHEEEQEDQEHESDNEDAEDDDEDQEEDEEDDEDDEDDEEDECRIAESALLHSPNPEPLGDATEKDICSVRLREGAICVVDSQGRTIGAIAEPWVGTLKECIEQGQQYRARILDIDGGKCEVRVTNKCLLNRDINLTAINTAVRDQLHPELSLSVETTTEGVVAVTDDGSRVGDVPDPWARLLNECIEQGRSYQAEVRDVTPEYCRVNIQTGTSDQ